jgi:hypothetical protein
MQADYKQFLLDPEVYGTAVLAIAINEFGTECLDWDPNALELELTTLCRNEIPDATMDRLMAAISILTTDDFFRDIYAFSALCNALNRGVISGDMWIPADLDDVLWAVTEVRMLLGEGYSDTNYSDNINKYVGILLQREGSTLKFAELDPEEERVYKAYDGDAVLEQAFWERQEEDRNNLEKENIRRLQEYMLQLSKLPIQSEWLTAIRSKFQSN